jgi:hypothetical protein
MPLLQFLLCNRVPSGTRGRSLAMFLSSGLVLFSSRVMLFRRSVVVLF